MGILTKETQESITYIKYLQSLNLDEINKLVPKGKSNYRKQKITKMCVLRFLTPIVYVQK